MGNSVSLAYIFPVRVSGCVVACDRWECLPSAINALGAKDGINPKADVVM